MWPSVHAQGRARQAGAGQDLTGCSTASQRNKWLRTPPCPDALLQNEPDSQAQTMLHGTEFALEEVNLQ